MRTKTCGGQSHRELCFHVTHPALVGRSRARAPPSLSPFDRSAGARPLPPPWTQSAIGQLGQGSPSKSDRIDHRCPSSRSILAPIPKAISRLSEQQSGFGLDLDRKAIRIFLARIRGTVAAPRRALFKKQPRRKLGAQPPHLSNSSALPSPPCSPASPRAPSRRPRSAS